MSSDMQERVINMLRENVGECSELDNIKPDDELSVLGINSVTFIKLVIAAEMEFGITWKDEDLNYQNFSTVNKIMEYISSSDDSSSDTQS